MEEVRKRKEDSLDRKLGRYSWKRKGIKRSGRKGSKEPLKKVKEDILERKAGSGVCSHKDLQSLQGLKHH